MPLAFRSLNGHLDCGGAARLLDRCLVISICCRFEQRNWNRWVGHAGILKLESWGNSAGGRRREEVCFQAEDEDGCSVVQ